MVFFQGKPWSLFHIPDLINNMKSLAFPFLFFPEGFHWTLFFPDWFFLIFKIKARVYFFKIFVLQNDYLHDFNHCPAKA